MKILYAIQGTGNGHLCRAMELIPEFRKYADVDVLISGIQSDLDPGQKVNYRLRGLSFIFGKGGGIDFAATWKKNSLKSIIHETRTVPVHHYDLVINDFEPVTAWACIFRNVPCIGVSHQAALWSQHVPKPLRRDWFGNMILNYYAPCAKNYGFHFREYDSNIYTPIIRKEIREIEVKRKEHYTVYLPAYSDRRIINFLMEFPEIQWEVFSKHTRRNYFVANVHINKPDSTRFIKSMASSNGIMCGAGFETPAEALFLGKKLLVIPMRSQYEQHYNARALEEMNVPVVKSLGKKHQQEVRNWIDSNQRIRVHYEDQTPDVVRKILTDFQQLNSSLPVYNIFPARAVARVSALIR